MENKDTFKMTYSAEQRDEVEQIRKKYVPQEPDKMDKLRAMDAGAERKATLAALVVGIIGTLVMGIGMSLTLTDWGADWGDKSLLVGVALGLLGIAGVVCAYPLYRLRLKKEREKIAPEILKLSEELMK